MVTVKKRRLAGKVLAAALLLAAAPAHAQPDPRTLAAGVTYPGAALHAACSARDSRFRECRAYVAGWVDVMRAGHHFTGAQWCLPANASYDEMAEAVAYYVTSRPAVRSGLAADIVADALDGAYGCHVYRQQTGARRR